MNASEFRKPTRFEGRAPQTYRVEQDSLQWSPRINRLLSFGAPDDLPKFEFDWDSLEGLSPEKVRERAGDLTRVFGVNAGIGVYHGQQMTSISRSPELSQFAQTPINNYTPGGMYVSNEQFIKSATIHPTGGMFAVVSQMSPSGGSALDDAAFLDPEDPQQWALVISVANGDELYCFRRLYHTGEP
jgi:hypothetical protein